MPQDRTAASTSFGCPEADAIVRTYRYAFRDLVLTEPLTDFVKYHFIVRLWRITGSPEWAEHPSMYRHLDDCALRLQIAERVVELGGHDAANWTMSSPALQAAEAYVPQAWSKSGQSSSIHESKKDMTQEKIRLMFLMSVSIGLHKLFDHGLDKQPAYRKACQSARDTLTASCRFFDPHGPDMRIMLLEEPAKATNSIYYLRRMNIIDYVDAAWEVFNHVWELDLVRRPRNLELYTYGLTHFALNESIYYQERIDLEVFEAEYSMISEALSKQLYVKILDAIDQNIDGILNTENPDIIAEVGLAFRLCNKEQSSSCQRCVSFIRSCVRYCSLERRTMLFSPNSSASRGLRRSEHSNCVALLLLAAWPDQLFRGPIFNSDDWDKQVAKARAALDEDADFGLQNLNKHSKLGGGVDSMQLLGVARPLSGSGSSHSAAPSSTATPSAKWGHQSLPSLVRAASCGKVAPKLGNQKKPHRDRPGDRSKRKASVVQSYGERRRLLERLCVME